ncbi:MAG TPA: hypothetical protein GX699_06675, partial [Firmicutes bacterium]|nr:hypothetical protein [Bacillota bacterium]
IRQQRAAVEKAAERYEPLVELQQSVNVKKELLTVAMGAEFGWRETLAALGAKIPADVWLTNMDLIFEDEYGMLTLYGLTYNHPATARWAEELATAGNISAVRIGFSAVEKSEDSELVRFELRAQVAPGELYQPPGGSEE